MPEFGLIKSFKIDDGQLDGESPQTCFVLGYELAQVDALLEKADEISKPIHALNRERIQQSCMDSGREFLINWLPGDSSESWMLLSVKPITNA